MPAYVPDLYHDDDLPTEPSEGPGEWWLGGMFSCSIECVLLVYGMCSLTRIWAEGRVVAGRPKILKSPLCSDLA